MAARTGDAVLDAVCDSVGYVRVLRYCRRPVDDESLLFVMETAWALENAICDCGGVKSAVRKRKEDM